MAEQERAPLGPQKQQPVMFVEIEPRREHEQHAEFNAEQREDDGPGVVIPAQRRERRVDRRLDAI